MRVKETIYSSNETTLNHMPMLASEWAHVIGKLTLKMLRVEKKRNIIKEKRKSWNSK